jgi:hypothetical protein
MATWKKVIVSGSTANLAALQVDNLTSAQVVIGGGTAGNLTTTPINGTGNIVATTGATGLTHSGAFTGSFSGSLTSSLTNVAKANLVAYDTTTGQFSYVGTGSITSATSSYVNSLTQSVIISGSLIVTGSITGSLYGTSSFAVSSSYALQATTSSYANIATSASYATQATSASYANVATSASYTLQSTSASYATQATSASYATQSTTASYATQSTTASYAVQSTSASYATQATSASYAIQATSASYATQATSASFSITSSFPLLGVITASVNNTTITFTRGNGTTFDVTVAQSGSVASSSYALYATSAGSASYATQATSASYTVQATSASYTIQATSASYATQATSASYAVQATSASFATNASALLNALTFGTGLSSSVTSFNGSAALTVAISGSATLSSNLIPKWTGTGLQNSNITDTGTQVQIGSGASGGVTIAAGGIGVTGNSTFNNNVTITGDLTVAGTASFTNTDNLTIKDKFILINSGSTVLADSGWVTQYTSSGSGSAFYLDANTTGPYGRFAVAYDVIGTSTSITTDEYVVTSKINQASGPSTVPPTWGTGSNGAGNMWVTTAGDIYIYS